MGICIIFFKKKKIGNVWTTNMRPYGHKKICKLYIICTLILSILLYLMTGSKLFLTPSELWIPIHCHVILTCFVYVLDSQRMSSIF
jgi:hypothetical protein